MQKFSLAFDIDPDATLVSLLPLCAEIVRRSLSLSAASPVEYTPKITHEDRLHLLVQAPSPALITGRIEGDILVVTVEETLPPSQPRVVRMGRIVARPEAPSDSPLFYAPPPAVAPRPPVSADTVFGPGPAAPRPQGRQAPQSPPAPVPQAPAAPRTPPAYRRFRPLDF